MIKDSSNYACSKPYNLTMIPFVSLQSLTAANLTEYERLNVRDCADVGRTSLDNIAECQKAASSLGSTYQYANSWSYYPKGCYSFKYDSRNVYWNAHEIGRKTSGALAICKAGGNYVPRYSILIHQEKKQFLSKLIYLIFSDFQRPNYHHTQDYNSRTTR